jgi:hypothetical protein
LQIEEFKEFKELKGKTRKQDGEDRSVPIAKPSIN